MNSLDHYRLNDVVDVYVKDLEDGYIYIQFYFINTRRKIGVSANSAALEVVKFFLEDTSLDAMLTALSSEYDLEELKSFSRYLIDNNILTLSSSRTATPEEYRKEANFVSEWIGGCVDEWPSNKRVLVVGCGAIGGKISELLVRAGINQIYLLDYKSMNDSDRLKHPHFKLSEVGSSKAAALAKYLTGINPRVSAQLIEEKITPRTQDEQIFVDDYDLVVNTADEPYIGYTSILLGRFTRKRGIPLYVAGGFDAHLFSTGDFYNFSDGACVECTAEFFTKSLEKWKPTYFVQRNNFPSNETDADFILGGAGGHFAASLFSASYAAMNILNYLRGGTNWKKNSNRRGEFNNVTGLIDWVDISRVRTCTHND